MNWAILIGFYVIWLIISAIRNNAKKRAASTEVQNNQNPPADQPQILAEKPTKTSSLFDWEIEREEQQAAQQSPSHSSRKQKSTPNHYSEEELVERFKKQHALGLPLKHHTHNLSADLNDVYEKGTAPKKDHPIQKEIRNPKSLRKAIIIYEILNPKF